MIRTALLAVLLLATVACGGDDSSTEPEENTDGWCCLGTWEECSAATPSSEGVCLGGLPCADQAGIACRHADATSICVWSDDITLDDGTSCRGVHGRRINESGEWESYAGCQQYPITESDCIW